VALVDLVVVLLVAGLLVLGGWAVRTAMRPADGAPGRLAERDRAWQAEQIAKARWAPAHDEVEGTTRVLLRRSYVGLDGRPAVLEERVFDTFPSADPAWEARFTETMSRARFRCSYLNAEELPG
jgi:hypothetical protein